MQIEKNREGIPSFTPFGVAPIWSQDVKVAMPSNYPIWKERNLRFRSMGSISNIAIEKEGSTLVNISIGF